MGLPTHCSDISDVTTLPANCSQDVWQAVLRMCAARPMCPPQGSTAALLGDQGFAERGNCTASTHCMALHNVCVQNLRCGRSGTFTAAAWRAAEQAAHGASCSTSRRTCRERTSSVVDPATFLPAAPPQRFLNYGRRPSGLRAARTMLSASAGSQRPTMRAVGRLALPVLSSGRAAAAAAAASSQVRSPPLWAKLPCSAPALSVFCRRSSKAACQSRTARHLQGARHLTVTAASAEGQAAQKDPAQTLLASVEHELNNHCCNSQGDHRTFDQYLVRRHWRQPCMLGRTHLLASLHASNVC